MQLKWHSYRYYPYERDLAIREARSILAPAAIHQHATGVVVRKPQRPHHAPRLVYFAEVSANELQSMRTQQSLLERVNGNGPNRQSTRYSAHGLHEYKGKFNPQVVKAILNILAADQRHVVLDPFCGSGTSLVECEHLGIKAVGTDINPLAVYIANAKLKSLGIPATYLAKQLKLAIARARRTKSRPPSNNERGEYLRSWFPPDALLEIERVRLAIESLDVDCAHIALAVASNLLRDYSLQEPSDLRIRRRKSPMPTVSFIKAFEDATISYSNRLSDAQGTLGVAAPRSQAIHVDCRNLGRSAPHLLRAYDIAVTSPPYATALPYIDTQRLSLVWLSLLPPSDVLKLEATLIGSREIRGESKKSLLSTMQINAAQLPTAEHQFCMTLQAAIGGHDGFRKLAVPRLLYRYLAAMAESFEVVRGLMKPKAPFALIVGRNRTILGGSTFEIDTPRHLANIAVSKGWKHMETIELQTYQRFGLHMSNATNSEALIILEA